MRILSLLAVCVSMLHFTACDNASTNTRLASDSGVKEDTPCYHYTLVNTVAKDLFFPLDNPWNQRVDSAGENAIDADLLSDTILQNHSDHNLKGFVRIECVVPYNVINHGALTDSIHGELADHHPDGSYDYLPENKIRFPTLKDLRVEATDPHLLVVDTGTKFLYELYKSRRDPITGIYYHQGASRFNLRSNELRGGGDTLMTSADAAGLPVLPGLLRWDEIERGEINHALRMTLTSVLAGYIAPATHAPADITFPADGLIKWAPMGARLRLNASFPEKGFSQEQLVVIHCLKRYGVFIADKGSNFAISATDDCRFASLRIYHNDPTSPSIRLTNKDGRELTVGDFEVVKLGHITPRK